MATVRAFDLRATPAADGATWAVFTFFFLVLAAAVAVGAVLLSRRVRRSRAAVAVMLPVASRPAFAPADPDAVPYAA